MLTQILREIRHFYPSRIFKGTYILENGEITLDEMDIPPVTGQYVLIRGSRNFGVCPVEQATAGRLKLSGEFVDDILDLVAILNIPGDLLQLSKEIEQWHNEAPTGQLATEKFGSYSYSAPKDLSWQNHFKRDLLPFRRMFSDLEV